MVLNAAFENAPEELDVTIVEQSSHQASAIDRAAAALTTQVTSTYHLRSCQYSWPTFHH